MWWIRRCIGAIDHVACRCITIFLIRPETDCLFVIDFLDRGCRFYVTNASENFEQAFVCRIFLNSFNKCLLSVNLSDVSIICLSYL